MNIISKDLNLLLIFQALWAEKNVSRAAEKLGLSQPALSNALARLRLDLNDPLFVRSSRGMVATPLAQKLAPQVDRIIQELSLLYGQEDFNPMTSDRVVTIWATDYFEQLLLPELLRVLEREAPRMRLISRALQGVLPKTEMEQGTCDLAIAGFFKKLPQGYFQQEVFQDSFKCVVRKNHPATEGKMTLKKYLELKHILINPSGDLDGVVDQLLREKDLQRSVVAGTSSFAAPGSVVQRTDFVLTAPEKLCRNFEKLYGLEVMSVPLTLPRINVVQVWHEKVHQDPAVQWLRGQIHTLCRRKDWT